MKKQLLCTSAIALGVAAAAPASAAEWNLDWGGFLNSHAAIVDTGGSAAAGTDFDGLRFFQTGEIIFTPSITLDNGITFGVNVQMEAQNGGGGVDGIDESYITISGDSFGRIELGSENSAGYKMMVAAPSNSSFFINSPSVSAFLPISAVVPFNFRQAGVSAYTEVQGNNDVQRISYFSPSFSGFSVGVSYAPNNNGNASQAFAGAQIADSAAATVEDIYDIGVNFSQSLGGADVSFGARYGAGDAVAPGANDPDEWGVGLQVGFGGITVGGHYSESDRLSGETQSGWSAGVTYDAPGPWTFGFETFMGDYDDIGGVLTLDGEWEAYQISASRSLGAGVTWQAHVTFVDAENELGGVAGADVDATVVGTALNLSF